MIEAKMKTVSNRKVEGTLLLVVISGIVALSFTVLAYMRLLDSRWPLIFVDMGFVGIMLLLFLFVCVGRKTRTASILIPLGLISAALTSTLLLGVNEIFWAFPALMVAYFMLDARQATILSCGFVGCFLAIVWDDVSAIALIKISLTLIVTVLLAHAFSLTNRRQMEDLRRRINVDPLTGAGNRGAQNLKLDSVAAIFRRYERPASLLLIDIDHFKRINDTHGHIAGDQILIALAQLVSRSTRATESLYRYGGEEFVLVAEHTELKPAITLAEKVRSLIEQNVFAAGIQVTVSIGVAQLHHEEDREGWFGRADAALYQAKGRGRNQVIAADAKAPSTIFRLPNACRSDELEAVPVVLSRSM